MNSLKVQLSFLAVILFLINSQKQVKAIDATSDKNENLIVFTVATEETDGYRRFMRSCKHYQIPVTTLGLGQEWKGGEMNGPGGGFKINLLRESLKPLKDNNKTIVLFTDSYDVLFTSDADVIIKKFKESKAKILFSAEKFCWPLEKLTNDYPKVSPDASRFLNSGGFIGYASYIYKLIKYPIKDKDDDQLFYTKAFLNKEIRDNLEMQLDTESKIFQNLNGAKDDVKLTVDLTTNVGILQNLKFLTTPSIIHGNGPSKIELNAFANYLAGTFNEKCMICEEERIKLDETKLPTITIALIITKPIPFFAEFLEKIANLNYPKKKIHLFVYNAEPYHDEAAKSFIIDYEDKYLSSKIISSMDDINERRGRQLAVQQAKIKKSDYLLSVDADTHLDEPELLRELLSYNKSVIAPVITKYDQLWSNFWGALTDGGYYARSHDYVDIVKRNFIGMWNVPYISSCYLIKKTAFKHLNFEHKYFDPDMAMCAALRDAGIFMYVINDRHYGNIVELESFDITLARPDFYTLFSNPIDWEKRYIHPEYKEQLKDNVTYLQPCPDVFWLRIVTDQFCDDLVAIMENFGKWSDGSNKDKRLEGGYEAVPTRDIHMNQVNADKIWLQFLKVYVRPLQEKIFIGYYHDPPKSLMNFVVRYRPDEQPFLRPHHDSSTYTINIALNRVGIDYQGGGCRFIRYNCSITATKKGWMLMHPGRLTHYHEGLRVTEGTRYIAISFIDP